MYVAKQWPFIGEAWQNKICELALFVFLLPASNSRDKHLFWKHEVLKN